MLARALAGRIDRLRETFAALDEAVREKVAEVAGKAVADAVRQAIRAALDAGQPPDPNDEFWADDGDPRRPRDPDDDWPPPVQTPTVPGPAPRAAGAVLAGCRAAAWWLARSAGRPWWGW